MKRTLKLGMCEVSVFHIDYTHYVRVGEVAVRVSSQVGQAQLRHRARRSQYEKSVGTRTESLLWNPRRADFSRRYFLLTRCGGELPTFIVFRVSTAADGRQV
jgi:hypothetical protein